MLAAVTMWGISLSGCTASVGAALGGCSSNPSLHSAATVCPWVSCDFLPVGLPRPEQEGSIEDSIAFASKFE